MGGVVGGTSNVFLVVCAAAVILTIACAGGMIGKAQARANINDYLWTGANDFYPSGYDRPGPVSLAIDTVGWNATRIMGNVGIGNGDTAIFDLTSTEDADYPDTAFMSGDISQQPWVPGLKNVPEGNATENETENETENQTENARGNATDEGSIPAENATSASISGLAGLNSPGFMNDDTSRLKMPGLKSAIENGANENDDSRESNVTQNAPGNITGNATENTGKNVTGANVSAWPGTGSPGSRSPDIFNQTGWQTNVSANESATNETGQSEPISQEQIDQANEAGEKLAFAAFRPIQYLNPVQDIMYEHPLATPGTAYCELLGFVPPSDVPINVGMKCTSYGY